MSDRQKRPPIGFVIAAILIVGALAWLKFYIQHSTLQEAAKELAEKEAKEQAKEANSDSTSIEE
ncbi:hypothetical protein [Rubellicoccus peritrichatus]|uniref:Uncharacterized protein n=1 Tax=Rubellicoccus peritrichatus TaxID=3080537 RepID=A0AAQ3LCF6_9BACT|nr:hypothetical protein [Puniceicoccus sp. CR14]WOO42807.1 hypothetical protein RZN69_06860 [Puniceicoccus sp. CR14]